jgi:hypothetical protein
VGSTTFEQAESTGAYGSGVNFAAFGVDADFDYLIVID